MSFERIPMLSPGQPQNEHSHEYDFELAEQQFAPAAPRVTGDELDFGDFDLNAAFQNALSDVVTDEELALDEKVMRMETIIAEGSSEVYQDFVDMRAIAAQMEMFCAHDHALNDALGGSEFIGGLLSEHADDGHDHAGHEYSHNNDDDTEEEDDKKSKKKKRKKRRWLK